MKKVSIFWFRRDLRIEDNHGLFQALSASEPVLPLFIFDTNILDRLPSKKDGRVEFIHQAITLLNEAIGGHLCVKHGNPLAIFKDLMTKWDIVGIYTNHDYERYGLDRDVSISELAQEKGIEFRSFKDQVVFEKDEVLSGAGTPYTVFTPYSRKWKALLAETSLPNFPSSESTNYVSDTFTLPSLADIGFQPSGLLFPQASVADELIRAYAQDRDFPAKPGTSRLSVHLRFGTLSIRSLVRQAIGKSEVWLNELIWRDFYFNILHHFPHISEKHSFRKEYDRMNWRNNEEEFKAWCEGKTGYPIVDAGMRELNATGFMHNRVRMIVASFLVKHLLIDWRWGEAYFAEKLLDFDFAANNGGWQWASGSGCDAAPYFRVFNPTLQTQKFDQSLAYIKKWVPELQELSYPAPIVNHELARARVLAAYKEALGK
ncbi:cryptochrome/photolyase family protein [Aquirufa antheringensis]|uniref:cryptochrome/photolyase family protein n=1 Tax=Aquirufa antheringensis TaxID=2516559 RepID=UPI0022A9E56B|nr:deoxyribodipyrimidine photo-lyase [Aquirufa antheringensis]MCZ2483932.1 deoxyribodipyrimidine photo-lyase [Aquirufa antheringensis]